MRIYHLRTWRPGHDARETLYQHQPAHHELYWAFITRTYSELDVTKPQDRLPALSGIASRVGEQFHSAYLVGLWKRFLPQELLWTAHVTIANPDHKHQSPTVQSPLRGHRHLLI